MEELPKSEKYKLYLSLKEELEDEIEEHRYDEYRRNIRQYQIDNKERLKEYQRVYNINHRKQIKCDVCECDVYEYYWKKHCMSKKHIRNKKNIENDS